MSEVFSCFPELLTSCELLTVLSDQVGSLSQEWALLSHTSEVLNLLPQIPNLSLSVHSPLTRGIFTLFALPPSHLKCDATTYTYFSHLQRPPIYLHASAFLPKSHVPKLWSSEDQREKGAGSPCCPPRQDDAHQLIVPLLWGFCRWLGQHPDLLSSGAQDSSDSWGFGLPTPDYFRLMLNSSAGKSRPEPPVKCYSSRARLSCSTLFKAATLSTHSPAPNSVRIQQQQKPVWVCSLFCYNERLHICIQGNTNMG